MQCDVRVMGLRKGLLRPQVANYFEVCICRDTMSIFVATRSSFATHALRDPIAGHVRNATNLVRVSVSEGHICQGRPPETPQIARAVLPCSHFSHRCKLLSLRQIRGARWLLLRLVLPTLADNDFVICRNLLGGASLRVLQLGL